MGCFPFARRYWGNHCCFLFLRLLRCFSSPRLLLQPMYSVADIPVLAGMGYPIQRSPDQSLFSSSPKLFAACRVFHRLLAPRHPPFTLDSLATKQLTQFQRLLFLSTSKLSKNELLNGYFRLCSALGRTVISGHINRLVLNRVVEVNGLEPMTSCLQSRRSPC